MNFNRAKIFNSHITYTNYYYTFYIAYNAYYKYFILLNVKRNSPANIILDFISYLKVLKSQIDFKGRAALRRTPANAEKSAGEQNDKSALDTWRKPCQCESSNPPQSFNFLTGL